MRTDFFSVINPQSAYWAGFIAADGNVAKDRNRIEIKIHSGDADHLMNFARIVEQPWTPRKESDNTVRFRASSPQWKNDLLKYYNITPKKSLTLQPPNLKRKTDIKAYITGLFDGDGSFGHYGRRDSNWKYLRFDLCGTRDLLEWVDENLPESGYFRKDKNIHHLVFGHKKAFNVHNHLWNPQLPLLDRKWNMPYKVYVGEQYGTRI